MKFAVLTATPVPFGIIAHDGSGVYTRVFPRRRHMERAATARSREELKITGPEE